MHGIIELIVTSVVLWVSLQVSWDILISVVYHFCVPRIVWGTIIIGIGLKVTRIPPPNSSTTQEVLGANPMSVGKDNNTNSAMSKDHGNGEQYCMRVVAHRGAGYDYPENSLTAFRNSKERGCTAVEFDLSLTKDNVPIVFHDLSIERLTGKIGIIKEMTWDQLNQLDITRNHPLKDKFDEIENIPILWDVLEMCLSNDQRIFIDVKESGEDVIQVILDAYKKYPKLYERGVISSFNPLVVYKIRRREPKIVGCIAWRPEYYSSTSYMGSDGISVPKQSNFFIYIATCIYDYIYEWMLFHFLYYIVGVSVLLLHKDVLNPRIVKEWAARDVRIIAWTVNLPSEKLHFSRLMKVTYLTDTLLVEKDM
ncbi:glycerophosphodiester phosphodiesterase 1 [Ceratina calcarata]|uniref:Glycerophosphodiester phosphodiesterase 1 n=1 Tax=Ceratina calcarata TaxID=156304 RepID=A0AAJ7RXK8_9HYME|nr:glycerophosphodiester phosphodiesterase 1 [Ceratina calcarata]XP_026667584.1 glycerophosphodiester phosphodiesterase 1 [Ceratina calcarata]XP_026667585.1 glycerophosphodiester phosphodiesterase 1 [Ceratina calcarata]XP_026667586.1 glycerophosphodiester phosphodiesterase 1 [Ceratina calcarata]